MAGKNKRIQLTKKTRFEVFKRDGFVCQYCGSTPPEVVLEVDHIEPVAKGGTNEIDNLLTACFDCNRGKSDVHLSSMPQTLVEKTAVIRECEEQLKEYRKALKFKKSRLTKDVNQLQKSFQKFYPKSYFTEKTKQSIKSQFLSKLDIQTLEENIDMACIRIQDNPNDAYKYFCGINWNQIKGSSW